MAEGFDRYGHVQECERHDGHDECGREEDARVHLAPQLALPQLATVEQCTATELEWHGPTLHQSGNSQGYACNKYWRTLNTQTAVHLIWWNSVGLIIQ